MGKRIACILMALLFHWVYRSWHFAVVFPFPNESIPVVAPNIPRSPFEYRNETAGVLKHLQTNDCHYQANQKNILPLDGKRRWTKKLPLFSGIFLTPHSKVDVERINNDLPYWTAHFSLTHITWFESRRVRRTEWAAPLVEWHCDDQLARVVAGGCPKGMGLTVVCPQHPWERIRRLTISNSTWKHVYVVSAHVDCELDHPLQPQPKRWMAQVSAWTMIYGDYYTPFKVLEWIEYHHMIGVDHFFLYMIDHDWTTKFENGLQWPALDYVTYVPWNVNQRDEATHNITMHQISSQQNAFLRSRALGMDWTVLCDLDEFVFVVPNNSRDHDYEDGGGRAKDDRLLPSFLKRMDPTAGGVEGQTVTYGSQRTTRTSGVKKEETWMLDYTERGDCGWGRQRQKTIVHTNYVDYHNMHDISLGNKPYMADPWKELRFNHYKIPWTGVTTDGKQMKTIADPQFRNIYKNKLLGRTKTVLLAMKHN